MKFILDPRAWFEAQQQKYLENKQRQAAIRQAIKQRNAARAVLRTLADLVMGRGCRIEFRPRHHDRTKRSQLKYDRLSAPEIKEIEGVLHQAYPSLNRAQRRYLARDHRYMSVV